MSLLDELKEKRQKALEEASLLTKQWFDLDEQRLELCQIAADCDIAIAALEAPAQPLDDLPDDIVEQITAHAGEIRFVEQDWTPTRTDAEITVADLSRLETKASVEERAEMVGATTGPWEPEIPEGFTKWEGGTLDDFCAVNTVYATTKVEAILRCGTLAEALATELMWEHESDVGDIIAYRILSQDQGGYAPVTETADAALFDQQTCEPVNPCPQTEWSPVVDATELPQVTPDQVPPVAEVIHTDDGRRKFALFGGQTHEVVDPRDAEAEFWARTLHPRPKEDA